MVMSSASFPAEQNVVVLARPEADAVALVRRALPDMAPNEALLRILSAGICGTDLHIVRWNKWAAATYRPPFALGHEFCAEVVEIGRAHV